MASHIKTSTGKYISLRKRCVSKVTLVSVLFLALTVLGWGTGSKVSQYDAPGSSSLILKAKLLSPRERVNTVQASAIAAPEFKTAFFAAWAALFITTLVLYGRGNASLRAITGAPLGERYLGASFFSFRPPPASFEPRT